MHRSHLEDYFDRMNDKLFFVLVIFIQVVFVFQGLDFTDSGFDADFYARIFSDPNTVQYNFSYWLTGIIGGLWLKLFPGLGLLGLRLAGLLITTITFWIAYDLLKKFLHTGPLRLSLFLILLFLSTSLKEISYEDITAMFFICAAYFLFNGLTKEKSSLIFLSGIFISLNTFSRPANIFGLMLLLAICFSGYLNRNTIRQVIRQSLLFISGFVILSVALIFLMRAMHHDSFFRNSLNLARQVGGPNNYLMLYGLFKQYILHFSEAIAISMVVIVAMWSSAAAWRRLKADLPATIPFLPVLKYGVLLILTGVCIYYAKKDPDFWSYLYLFYAGTSLIVGFLIVTGRQPKNLRILASIGCIMLLAMPVGAGDVLMTLGKYSLWIIVPITVDYLLSIRALSSRVVVSENSQHSYEQVIDVKQMTGLRKTGIYLTLIYILSITYFYPWFDRNNRSAMHFQVNNEHMRGIFTTARRAGVINELLTQSALYVKPEDYVLAYDCIPMYYYMTDTKPYMHNSWVWLYDDEVFKEELYKSYAETKICPVVIMQKRSTIDNNWPDNYSDENKFRPEATACLQEFLKAHQYHQVWENDFFKMYLPASKSPPVAKINIR